MPISASGKRTLIDMEEILKENESAVEVTKPETALEKLEREKMTRRQALGRIGFLAGASAVAALTSDELTRLVGKEMQRRAGDSKVVAQVAKEFENAGVASAAGRPACYQCYAYEYFGSNNVVTSQCGTSYCNCRSICPPFNILDPGARGRCLDRCKTDYSACITSMPNTSGCTSDPVDCQC
jgi:hypothetical protein